MRVKHKVIVQVARDADMKNTLFSTDETLAEVIADGFDRSVTGLLHVAATVTESVPLGDVDVPKGLYLEVDQDCQVAINGSADLIQLRKSSTASSVPAKLFLEADISSLAITAGATAVNGAFCVWGDPS